jgi:hypothetical protein
MPYPAQPINPNNIDYTTDSIKIYSGSPQYFPNTGGHRTTMFGGRQIFIVTDNSVVPYGTKTKALKRS